MTNDERRTTNDERRTTNDERRTTNDERRTTRFAAGLVTALAALGIAACTTPNPNYRRPNSDGGVDPTGDAPMCMADQPLRCDGDTLKRCNADGTAEVSEPCSLGCNSAKLRCADVSNGLAKYIDMANRQMEFNLGDSATMNTDTGDVIVGGSSAPKVFSETMTQPNGPDVRVFVVKSLVAKLVTITGKNAFALVSSGDININGVLSASAIHGSLIDPTNHPAIRGSGAFADGNCRGKTGPTDSNLGYSGGVGGGGFGKPGGAGGSAQNSKGFEAGWPGGDITGNSELVPLRGGCGGGASPEGGGGAIQLVSRTQIAVNGVVAANGATSGGSGGGILLEAPFVEVTGAVVANGAGGGVPGLSAEDGRLDAKPARGSDALAFSTQVGAGGSGGAGNFAAAPGSNIDVRPIDNYTVGGSGGGGVGRIRVNTSPGGLRGAGVFSPPPSQGAFASQ